MANRALQGKRCLLWGASKPQLEAQPSGLLLSCLTKLCMICWHQENGIVYAILSATQSVDGLAWGWQERRKAAEMAAQNQRLQQHLQETTSSFREALQLVESLMGGMPYTLQPRLFRGQALKCGTCSLLVMCKDSMQRRCLMRVGLSQLC